MKRNLCYIAGELLDENGELCAEAEMVYFTFPQQKSIEMGWYPANYDDFFE